MNGIYPHESLSGVSLSFSSMLLTYTWELQCCVGKINQGNFSNCWQHHWVPISQTGQLNRSHWTYEKNKTKKTLALWELWLILQPVNLVWFNSAIIWWSWMLQTNLFGILDSVFIYMCVYMFIYIYPRTVHLAPSLQLPAKTPQTSTSNYKPDDCVLNIGEALCDIIIGWSVFLCVSNIGEVTFRNV